MLIVQKFGGSSLADAERLRRAAGIIADTKTAGSETLAVLSARGKTTDRLVSDAAQITEMPTKRELDALLSTGELSSAALMAMQLHSMGLDCVSLSGRQAGILTDDKHGEARIKNINTQRIMRELAADKIVLVAGFQGINENDDVTTLGRGGSDTTAVALAAALNADRCEIYSDVDGIYTADPRLVSSAKKLHKVDPEDMLRLALGGSQVLHSRSVEAAINYGVKVHLLSSFVKNEGTLMTAQKTRPRLCGVTRDKAENKISLVGQGASKAVLAEMIAVLGNAGIVVHTGECTDGVCAVTVEHECVLSALEIVHAHFFSFAAPL